MLFCVYISVFMNSLCLFVCAIVESWLPPPDGGFMKGLIPVDGVMV